MILIKGIKMPKKPDEMIELAIFGDGRTVKTGESWRSPVDGKCYYGPSEDMNTYSAFTVPPHDRLIEKNAVFELIQSMPSVDKLLPVEFMKALQEIPTVIEAEEGE